MDRNAERHYDCLDFASLAALSVSSLAADNAVLFLWTTDPMLSKALWLIQEWGFEYKTVAFYWVKLNKRARHPGDYFTGLGYWTRANPEQCLLATKGNPKRLSKVVSRLIVSPRREHSRKPDEVRARIEQLVPGPYIELFARQEAPNWTTWGNEVQRFSRKLIFPELAY